MKVWLLPMLLFAGITLTAGVTYSYDDAGRLALVDYGNGTTIAYTYDQAGNLLSRTVTTPSSSTAAPQSEKKLTPADQSGSEKSRKLGDYEPAAPSDRDKSPRVPARKGDHHS